MDDLFSSSLADAFFTYENRNGNEHLMERDDTIIAIHKLKEEYIPPNQGTCLVPPYQQDDYRFELLRLMQRVEKMDRNLHDLCGVILPREIVEPLVWIIETARLQFRLFAHDPPVFILPFEAINTFTVALMNTELAVLAVQDVRATIAAYLDGRRRTTSLNYCFRHALRRYLTTFVHPVCVNGDFDIEEQMELRLQSRVRELRVVFNPESYRWGDPHLDILPCESIFSLMDEDLPHPSISELEDAFYPHRVYCPSCVVPWLVPPSFVCTSPPTGSNNLGLPWKRTSMAPPIGSYDVEVPLKRSATKLPKRSTISPPWRRRRPQLFMDDSDLETFRDDRSDDTLVGEEEDREGAGKQSVPEYVDPICFPHSRHYHWMSYIPMGPIWSLVRNIFRTMTL
ncbi:hypothetical protein BXZ70DRAFT_704976 [Cristinia sonorae]|uniref:Uncharacterized protein n=1 Tax=Cristinia sonorae TaxID=1940300 RepID=A0A8K0XJQ0_9AGAR|nr:hypothetical protein BXZ70DRAFT_704976 [Cristinia sonorae]